MKQMPKPIVKAEVCGTCMYYRQHFIFDTGGRLQALWYGHCHVPRVGRYPTPDQTCEHYAPWEATEQ